MTPVEEKPKYLICDNHKKYGTIFERMADTAGIEVIHAPSAPPRRLTAASRETRVQPISIE